MSLEMSQKTYTQQLVVVSLLQPLCIATATAATAASCMRFSLESDTVSAHRAS